MNRLNAQHRLLQLVMDGELFLPHIDMSKINRIADVATGTGYVRSNFGLILQFSAAN